MLVAVELQKVGGDRLERAFLASEELFAAVAAAVGLEKRASKFETAHIKDVLLAMLWW